MPKSNKVTPDSKAVFVVHGRDENALRGLTTLLESFGLRVVRWEEARSLAAKRRASPTVLEIVQRGMAACQAIVILFTPDESARLKTEFFRQAKDDIEELHLTGQSRPNVIFEAGLALGLHADRTILVDKGAWRVFSDLAGVQRIVLTESDAGRQLWKALDDTHCDLTDFESEKMDVRFESSIRERYEAWERHRWDPEYLMNVEQLQRAQLVPDEDEVSLAFALVSSFQWGPKGMADEWIHRARNSAVAADALVQHVLYWPHRRPRLRAAKALECIGAIGNPAIDDGLQIAADSGDEEAVRLLNAARTGQVSTMVERLTDLPPLHKSELLGEFLDYSPLQRRRFGAVE